MVFASMAARVVVRALTNETFPTSRRGTAGGLLSLMETLGAALGLFLYTFWMASAGNQALVIGSISILAAVSALSLFLFPETRQRELEAICATTVEQMMPAAKMIGPIQCHFMDSNSARQSASNVEYKLRSKLARNVRKHGP